MNNSFIRLIGILSTYPSPKLKYLTDLNNLESFVVSSEEISLRLLLSIFVDILGWDLVCQ